MTTLVRYPKTQNGMLSFFDRFFDDNFFSWNPNIPTNIVPPKHDIIENDNEYQVELSMPGVKKIDVDIGIDGNVLTVKAERKENKDLQYNTKCSFFGKYEKSFNLPDNINADNINASMSDGVLKLIAPKIKPDSKVSKKVIEIK